MKTVVILKGYIRMLERAIIEARGRYTEDMIITNSWGTTYKDTEEVYSIIDIKNNIEDDIEALIIEYTKSQ